MKSTSDILVQYGWKSILADLQYFDANGFWKDGKAPQWAKELAEFLQVATGSGGIMLYAWKHIALVLYFLYGSYGTSEDAAAGHLFSS